MKIAFYDRSGTVYVRVNKDGRNIRMSTGILVNGKWDDVKEEFANASNASLLKEKARIAEIAERAETLEQVRSMYNVQAEVGGIGDNETDLVKRLKDYEHRVVTGRIKKKKTMTPLAKKTRLQISWAISYVEEFAKNEGNLDLSRFDLSSGRSVAEKRSAEAEWRRWWAAFVDDLVDKELAISTRSVLMTVINTAVSNVCRELYIMAPEVPTVPPNSAPIIVIQPDDVPGFVSDSDELYETFGATDKFLWEISAVMIISTMRVSDALALTMRHLTEKDGLLYMNKRNQKTGAFTLCPLTPLVSKRLLDNYNTTGNIYTRPGRAVYLASGVLKTFFQKYEFAHRELTVSMADHMGGESLQTKPLYEWITAHTMRKTGITAMIYNKIDDEYIRMLSGHKPGSKAFERYKGWVNANYNESVLKYQQAFLTR